MNWAHKLVGGTRGKLLALLRRSRRSIHEMAATLGITDNAVRMHVAAMQRDGMVREAGVERATGGKPAQLFEITREAEEIFPKAYALVLGELIGLLVERRGRREVIDLLREIGARAGAKASPPDADEARVRAAAEALRDLGGEVDVERTDRGWKIRGHGCPLSAVAGEHSEVCALAESLVGQITGNSVRECCDRSERPRCGFEVKAGPAGVGVEGESRDG
jgi:predicted ArsR family transcriptional regulator